MKRIISLFGLFISIILFSAHSAQAQNTYDYDVLIKDGSVFDGSLKPAFKADVAIRDGRIVRVSENIEGTAARIIDAEGLYVSPGFIDLHTHVDRGMTFPETRACLNYLLQGVTSVVVGQCGSSAWPIVEKAEDQMKRWSNEGIGPNAALMVGHGSVRELVLGMEDRAPTPDELERMKILVKEAMEQGAHGLSTGLIYRPGSYAETEEVIELVKIIKPYGGIYHTHVRNEREELLDAVKEAVEISEKTGVPSHISHFKVMGKENWGLVREACALIEEAQKKGFRITADQYPYRFSSNYPYRRLIPDNAWRGDDPVERLTTVDIEAIFDNLRDDDLIRLYTKVTPYYPISKRHQQFLGQLPRKRLVSLVADHLIHTGNFRGPGNERERMLFYDRMKDPREAELIKQQVRDHVTSLGGPENVVVGICVREEWERKSLQEITAMTGKSAEDVAIELELMGARAVALQMCDEDIETIMKKDYVGTGSDGEAPFFGIGLPHIRSYSTFLHKIKKYGLDRKTVSLAHIIRSQTSLPAQIMNWVDRGRIKKGMKADIVVLDLANIGIETSISNAHRYSEGVEWLIVNGKLVIEDRKFNGILAGEVIRLKK